MSGLRIGADVYYHYKTVGLDRVESVGTITNLVNEGGVIRYEITDNVNPDHVVMKNEQELSL